MKEDTLEKFIRENHEKFDVHDPDPRLWNRIRQRIEKPGAAGVNWKPIAWRAAAVGIIIIASVLVSEYLLHPELPFSGLTRDGIDETRIPELQEAEIYYTSQLQSRYQKVQGYLKDHPGLENELIRDFMTLDSIYAELKKDLKDNVSNREVVEALIQNYRIRITLLEDLLLHLENTEEGTDHENNTREL